MKVKFLKDAYVNGEVFAREGDVKEFTSIASAKRWLNRGHVEVSSDEPIKEIHIKSEELEEVEPEICDEVEEEEVADFDEMTKKQLLAYAKENEIEIPSDVKKVEEIRSFLKEDFL